MLRLPTFLSDVVSTALCGAVVLTALGVTDLSAAAQQPKLGDKKPVDKEQLAELEKTLLTMPEKIEDRDAWLTEWRKNLSVSFRTVRTRFSTDLVGMGFDNRTPCSIKVGWINNLHKDGRKTKGSPPADGWTVEPGQKLNLAAQPGIRLTAIKNDFGKKVLVSSLSTEYISTIHMRPVQTKLEPLDLILVIRYAENGAAVVSSTYYFGKEKEREALFKLLKLRE